MNQNFTIYTEVDAGGKVTITAPKILASNMLRNEDCYAYRDFGAGYFDDLDVDFEIYTNSDTENSGLGVFGLSASTVNDAKAWGSSDVMVQSYKSGGNLTFYLVRGDSVAYDGSIVLSANTLYYCTLSRAAGNDTITCTIYSNSIRTAVVDTLSVAGFGTTTYRYLYGLTSYNDGASFRWDGYIQNVNINKGGGGFSAFF